MSDFNAFSDTPFQIKIEGENINVSFKPGLPVTGQGTVNWNIPAPARGCKNGQESGAYCGIVILLNEGSPVERSNAPVDGTFYTPDPTVDSDLHAGDNINNALVIGAFYEGEKKSRGESLTTSFVVSDLKPHTQYFVAAYAVDCQGRYHTDGIRAYADEYGNNDEPDTAATQTVKMDCSKATLPTDGTGLTPGIEYRFDVIVDNTFPVGESKTLIEVDVDGIDVGTYEQLLTVINRKFALAENPVQSPVPPSAGQYYWSSADGGKLFLFDGTTHNRVEDIIQEANDPTYTPVGGYWFNPVTKELKRWNVPSPTGWNDISLVEYTRDPLELDCNDYWFDGSSMFMWKDINWCEQLTVVNTTSPGSPPVISCGTFWYDIINGELKEWDFEDERWENRSAIYWNDQPNNLAENTFWFDLSVDSLNQRVMNNWIDIPVHISDIMPSNVEYWFNPTTELLSRWDGVEDEWMNTGVLVWSSDPANTEMCRLWWRTSDEALLMWDTINDQWNEVTNFIQSEVNPCMPESVELDTVWIDPVTQLASKWDGGQWISLTYISHPTDPTNPATAAGWLNPNTNTLKIYGTPSVGWNPIDPVDSETNPETIPNGMFWFDTTNSALYVRNGISWLAVAFTTMPLTPAKGATWYDSSAGVLMEWTGNQWIEGTPVVRMDLDGECNIILTSRDTGSAIVAFIAAPEGYAAGACPASGYADYSHGGDSMYHCEYHGSSGSKVYPVRDITTEEFLWNNLPVEARVLKPKQGTDGLSGSPSYEQLDVGDDGSPDERRELIDSIRAQLGYPVVEVELTKQQFDTAIQGALESFRKRSSRAYKRGYYFVDVERGQQHYQLTNKTIGYHKIVTVVAAHRMSSAFLSSANGAGIYGQLAMQQLYTMGTYDLTSFHLIAQYMEQLEHLFATRLTFNWNEDSRLLSFYNSFHHGERVLIECSVERTEQEILKDRMSKSWIERYALSEAMMVLAQIRGKYASLPGAGGGVSLNASELMATAQQYREEVITQAEDFIADDPESWGLGSTICIG